MPDANRCFKLNCLPSSELQSEMTMSHYYSGEMIDVRRGIHVWRERFIKRHLYTRQLPREFLRNNGVKFPKYFIMTPFQNLKPNYITHLCCYTERGVFAKINSASLRISLVSAFAIYVCKISEASLAPLAKPFRSIGCSPRVRSASAKLPEYRRDARTYLARSRSPRKG